MQVVGFTLTKILIERKESPKGKFKVTSKIDVKEIKEEKAQLAEGKEVAKMEFGYSINYEPDMADIEFKGFVLIMGEPKEIKELIAGWKKKKEMTSEIKLRIFNTIFYKCNIRALELEDDFNLPPHLHLPTIKPEEGKKESTYTG